MDSSTLNHLPQSAEPVVEKQPSDDLLGGVISAWAAEPGLRNQVETLTSERDQLRKELEEEKGRLAHAEFEWRKVWKPTAEARGEESIRQHERAEAAEQEVIRLTTENAALKERVKDESEQCVTYDNEIRRLRSQFRWIPISERLPTEKDAIDGMLWMRTYISGDVRHRHWTDASSFDLWMTPILPPAPSPETEEQTSRKQFEEIMIQRGTSIERDPVDGDHYAIARTQQDWKLWQRCREWAAKQSTGGQA